MKPFGAFMNPTLILLVTMILPVSVHPAARSRKPRKKQNPHRGQRPIGPPRAALPLGILFDVHKRRLVRGPDSFVATLAEPLTSG
jgi:hypothetical protein